jgi:hypothetical protein
VILGGLLERLGDRNRRRELVQHVVRSLKGGIELAELWRGQQLAEQAHWRRAGNRRNERAVSGQLSVASGVNMQLAAGSVGLLARQASLVLTQDRMQEPPANRCGHVQQEAASHGHFVER